MKSETFVGYETRRRFGRECQHVDEEPPSSRDIRYSTSSYQSGKAVMRRDRKGMMAIDLDPSVEDVKLAEGEGMTGISTIFPNGDFPFRISVMGPSMETVNAKGDRSHVKTSVCLSDGEL